MTQPRYNKILSLNKIDYDRLVKTNRKIIDVFRTGLDTLELREQMINQNPPTEGK